jgi:phospholipase A1/A2
VQPARILGQDAALRPSEEPHVRCAAPPLAAALLLALDVSAQAQTTVPEVTRPEPPPAPDPATAAKEYGRLDFRVDPDAYSIVSAVRGLSTHKATYVFPVTYSPEFSGDRSELVFQISAKQRLFGSDFYLAYTQRSFWQLINNDESSPFRETNYGPEIFYRWIPDPDAFNHWGADFGFEHESNGRTVPESRSWNRVYFAPFQAKGRGLAYLKFWYRIPEDDKTGPLDPKGDDNPDITDYYGHGELMYSRQIGGEQLLTAMVRGNPGTGHGAVSLTWSIPSDEGWVFYAASLFHGYGESLIYYDTSVTRLMLGVMLAR